TIRSRYIITIPTTPTAVTCANKGEGGKRDDSHGEWNNSIYPPS
ncbi:hypothetical protein C5S29_10510, partial [ANME-1 cluster archaeon GoMg3.2]|nr:hypothetical protein [ANME-1 cluster archaeon GoMg3.2]